MRLSPCLAIGLAILIGATTAQAKDKSGAALFERQDPAFATMTLSREGEDWRLSIRAAGLPDGAATAADCEIVAIGTQDADDLITAHVVPFEGELVSLTEEDIGPDDLTIAVQIGPEGAFATDHGAAAKLCGMGSEISGFYQRVDTPE